mmetsp:Transcript_26877/g.58609  ORF Transcript_26877/g.58609 Transcript_26877/m.58609 type:complete len:573 (-) Transcript_26877:1835-3553(-)
MRTNKAGTPSSTTTTSTGPNPSRWFTREYYAYIMIVGSSLAWMAWRGYDLSMEFQEEWESGRSNIHLPGIRDGWFLGLKMDVSDHQWRMFRDQFPLMTVAAVVHLMLSKLARLALPAEISLVVRWALSLIFVTYLHGSCMLFVLGLSLFNFILCHAVAGRMFAPAFIWGFNCGALVFVRLHNGFQFSAIHPSLTPLDYTRGIFRWHICYNMVVLKMISFGMDLHWRQVGKGLAPDSRGITTTERLTYRSRTLEFQRDESFGLLPYWCYLFYPPLYIAGPTVSFNAFASQVNTPQTTYSPYMLAKYAARLAISGLCLEMLTHTIHANSLASSGLWRVAGLTCSELGITSFWVLNFMWLKFLVVWRCFRLWALLDGVESPENIGRCVNNNYDIEGFWKNWHSSFNRWLVRYMYIPLGGSRLKALNIWVIFTYVALWHDLNARLLMWAWLSCFFAGPEILAKWIARCPAVRPWKETWQYRHTCAAFAAVNIFLLMTANLVGFVVGIDGVHEFVNQMATPAGAAFFPCMFAFFFSLAQIQFEVRAGEARAATKALREGEAVPTPEPAVVDRSFKYT